jgi:isocitrate dehydrogenase kinase/phosphatase
MGQLNWTEWTDTFLLALDVFGVKQGTFFSLEQVYTLEPILGKIYPKNSNLRAKIRQQLQVLRDHDRVVFLDDQGHYQRVK